jgi:hypothetical protein
MFEVNFMFGLWSKNGNLEIFLTDLNKQQWSIVSTRISIGRQERAFLILRLRIGRM